MELVKIEKISFPVNATPEHKQLVWAAKQKPLKEFSESELIQAVSILIDKAKNIAGQKNADLNVIETAIETLVEKIKSGGFGNLTAQQLEIITKKGALGEYGEFMGINAKSIRGWITAYRNDHLKYHKKQLLHEQQMKDKMEAEKRSQHFKENEEQYILDRWKKEYETLERLKDYQVYDPQNKFYKRLVDKGLSPVPHPERERFKDMAKSLTKEELRVQMANANNIVRTHIKGWLKDIDFALINKPVMRSKFESLVMTLIVTDYMKSHLDLGSSFEEMIGE